jgi:hypothetical protein
LGWHGRRRKRGLPPAHVFRGLFMLQRRTGLRLRQLWGAEVLRGAVYVLSAVFDWVAQIPVRQCGRGDRHPPALAIPSGPHATRIRAPAVIYPCFRPRCRRDPIHRAGLGFVTASCRALFRAQDFGPAGAARSARRGKTTASRFAEVGVTPVDGTAATYGARQPAPCGTATRRRQRRPLYRRSRHPAVRCTSEGRLLRVGQRRRKICLS